jgi:hypothetical protein
VQRSQDSDGSDRGAREFGRDVQCDRGEAQYIDLQHLSGAARRLEILPAVVPQTEIQALSGRRLFDGLGVAFELVADCGSNEVGSVRVKTLLNHQIDMAEIDEPEIDRDLFTFTGLGSQWVHIIDHAYHHPYTIRMDGIWMAKPLRQGRLARGMAR